MKKLYVLLTIMMLLISCISHEKSGELEGLFTGKFTYGDFTDNISFEIQNDSANRQVFFSSLEQNAIKIPLEKYSSSGRLNKF